MNCTEKETGTRENIPEDYIKPPCYTDSSTISSDPLVKKLQIRIQKDIHQINGVYDEKISEEEDKKKRSIAEIEKEFEETVGLINQKRKDEISEYNGKAEKYIDNLINNMNTPPETSTPYWFVDLLSKFTLFTRGKI